MPTPIFIEQKTKIYCKHVFLCHCYIDCDAVTVNVETHELVVDAARCIESTKNYTNHTEVFVSLEYSMYTCHCNATSSCNHL